jgi:UDP-N-acetylmuramoylalanine-D-glutamate ligase
MHLLLRRFLRRISLRAHRIRARPRIGVIKIAQVSERTGERDTAEVVGRPATVVQHFIDLHCCALALVQAAQEPKSSIASRLTSFRVAHKLQKITFRTSFLIQEHTKLLLGVLR